MKKLLLLLISGTFVFTTFSQQVISNAEDIGTGWWPAGSAGAVDLWDNPLKDGVNSTNKAITVWINNTDADYTGGGIGGLNINVSTYNTISVMVYKLITGKVRLELQDGVTSNRFITADYTTPGTWQKLTFAIPTGMSNITTLLVAPHFENYTTNPIPDGEAHRMWWDEVVAFNNPSTGISTLFNSSEIVKTEIYSLTGSLVETIKGKFELSSNSKIKKGFYIIKETDSNGNSKSDKICIK